MDSIVVYKELYILFVTGKQRERNYVCKAYVTQNYHLTEF